MNLKHITIEQWPGIDGYDLLPRTPLSQEYIDAVLPEHVKGALTQKAAGKDIDVL